MHAGRSPYLEEGLRLFREGDYFMAHEVWEEHWVEVEDAQRDFFQGLIHVAVGMHHERRGNHRGAVLQFSKALKRLQASTDEVDGVDVAALRVHLGDAVTRIDRGDAITAPPL